MDGVKISGLPGTTSIDGSEIMPVVKNGNTINISVRQIFDLAVSNEIRLEFNWNGTSLGVRVHGDTTYTYVDLKGDKGDQGIGILNITKDHTSGLSDIYKITFTDETTTTFTVVNGSTWIIGSDLYWYKDGVKTEYYSKGDKGDTGLQGIQGEKGDKGAQGDKGDTGLQGIQGEKGDKGAQGEKGDTGLQGIQGEKGDTGNSGVALQDTEPTDPAINVWIDPTGESNTVVVDKITMDESITAPANISGDVNGSVIKKIRSLHRRCLAKYLGNGKMAICYLQNDNSNFYHDGTAALLDGTEGDIMIYRPSYAHLYEYIDSDRFNISFALQPLNGLWRTVDECLIGAYEAYSANNKLYSRSGVPSAGNISQTNFKAYARARGAGYQLIDYDMHKEIPWLFYALYGTRNCQAICGSGTNAYDKATGQTNGIGNTDTTTVNGNTMSVNFLGIENCWGNKYEFIDNVIYNPDASSLGVWQISDIKTGTIRRVQGVAPGNAWVWPKRMISDDELDVIAKEGGLSDSTGYCDGQYLSTSITRVVMRSYVNSGSYGGVSCAGTYYDASYTVANYGSRLAFRGEITVYENVEAFKALSVTN